MTKTKKQVKEENRAVDRQIGARVRMYRMQKGLTQEGLAESQGITFQQIQKYEKGPNRISGSRLTSIAHTLGVTGAKLLGEGEAEGTGPLTPLLDISGALEVLRMFNLMSARQRHLFVQLGAEFVRGEEPANDRVDAKARRATGAAGLSGETHKARF